MDLVLRNTRLEGASGAALQDIGIADGRIAAIAAAGPESRSGIWHAASAEIDIGGRLVTGGFVESHIHLDKSCIFDRCRAERGDLAEAIEEVARVKASFTPDDVYARG